MSEYQLMTEDQRDMVKLVKDFLMKEYLPHVSEYEACLLYTSIGCTPQLTANALLEQTTGLHMSMFTMFGPGFCMLLLYLAGTQLFGYNLGKKIWSDRPEEAMELENTNRKIISGAVSYTHLRQTS